MTPSPEAEKKAIEIANVLWTQITKQMRFIGIITPETPRLVRMWIENQIAAALTEFGEACALNESKKCAKHREKANADGYARGIEEALAQCTPKAVGYLGRLSDVFTALQCAQDNIRALAKGTEGKQ